MPRRVLALVLAAACAGGVTACSSGRGANGGFVGGDGSYTRIDPAKRQPAPALEGTDLDGRPVSTATYAGKIVVLNVWGSWCAPCRKEAPELVKAAQATTATAQFVGLDTRDLDPAPARAFVRANAITYPNFHDPDGSLLLRLGGQVPPNAIPTTLVIDAQGRVAARVMGETTATTLQGIISDVAAGK